MTSVASCGTPPPLRATWSGLRVTPTPVARFDGMAAYDAARHEVVAFGGMSLPGYVFDDTWAWTSTKWVELHPRRSPPPLSDAVMAYDDATRTVVLCGGFIGVGPDVRPYAFSATPQQVYRDRFTTWIWNGTTWSGVVQMSGPPSENFVSCAYDAATKSVLLYMVYSVLPSPLGETWEWNGKSWIQLHPATSPPVTMGGSMAYDPATKDVILFGGASARTPHLFGSTWSWNGSTWTELHPRTSPSPREEAAMAYDPAMDGIVLVGGAGRHWVVLHGIWFWNGRDWLRVGTAPSAVRTNGTDMVALGRSGALVLFGGRESGRTSHRTWILRLQRTSSHA